MNKKLVLLCALMLCLGALIFVVLVSGGQAAAGGPPAALEGTFTILWGDGEPGSGATATRYFLSTPAYGTLPLQVSPEALAQAGGGLALNGQAVTVRGRWLLGAEAGGAVIVDALALAHQPAAPQDVIGAQPWVSIMCKFQDVSAEPKDLAYFQGMFSSFYPGLDHYWMEQSYGLVTLQGSGAVGWYTLPHPRSYYVPTNNPPPYMNWWLAAQDCAAVADADVYFPDYVGINFMFNDHLDGYAWGGSWYTTLDGTSQTWRATWEPPWGYGNVGVIAHENGHGFGLPHSNWGDIGYVYDNAWDVMSDLWANTAYHPTYGELGQHTIAFHKAMLGWVPQSRIVVVNPGQARTVTLERLGLPAVEGSMAVRLPINGDPNYFYTVEARQQVGNYDVGLPTNAVVIHEVLTSREDAPAFLMGSDGGLGGAWTPGETFTDAAHGIQISVISATSSGFVVTVRNQFVDITGVDLQGPLQAYENQTVSLTATVSPLIATLPITYVWQASGQLPITYTGTTQAMQDFQWSEPGTQAVTVTVNNGVVSVSDVHTILIKPIPLQVSLSGPREVLVGQPYTYTASSILQEGTLPITYTWQAAGLPPVTNVSGLTDTIQVVWPVTGTQMITVTVENAEHSAAAEQVVQVLAFAPQVSLSGRQSLALDETGLFTADSLYDGTGPITYTWQVSGMLPVTHTGGLSDTLELAWSEPGTHTLTVTMRTIGFFAVDMYQVVTFFAEVQGVTLDGPAQAYVDETVVLAAAASPVTATLPITYVWQVSGQAPITRTGAVEDMLNIQWSEPGTRSITVTVSNGSDSFTAYHTVLIKMIPLQVSLSGPSQVLINQPYAYLATSVLLEGDPPITYSWQASGLPPVTHTSGLTDTFELAWSEPGTHTLTVTAQTVGFNVSDARQVVVFIAGPQGVTLDGLPQVNLGQDDYQVTAHATPLTVTLPLTYSWQVDGVDVLTVTGGLSNTLTIEWETAGLHTIHVAVTNRSGLIVESQMDVMVVTRIYLPFAVRQP